VDSDKMKRNMREELWSFSKEFYQPAYSISRKGGKSLLTVKEFVET